MLGVGDDEVEEFLVEAWRRTGYWFTPAPELYKVRGEPEVYTTGSEALDNLLGGGVHTRSMSLQGSTASERRRSPTWYLSTLWVNVMLQLLLRQ